MAFAFEITGLLTMKVQRAYIFLLKSGL